MTQCFCYSESINMPRKVNYGIDYDDGYNDEDDYYNYDYDDGYDYAEETGESHST